MSNPTPDSLRIAVASGKGGTGKTTVAVSLAKAVGACLLADFDVESPSVQIFVGAVIDWKEAVTVLYAVRSVLEPVRSQSFNR